MNEKDTLLNIFTSNFAFNHLFNVSLMKRVNTPERDYKDKCIFFVTLAPGANKDNGRTYEFDRKIVLKYSTREIYSLAFALKSNASGRYIPYTKFSGDNTVKKYVSIFNNIEKNQKTQEDIVSINIMFCDNNNNKYSIKLTQDQAYGIGCILEKSADKALQLEMESVSPPKIEQPKVDQQNYKAIKSSLNNDFDKAFEFDGF